MKLEIKKFKDYVKSTKITLATINDSFREIPAGTKLNFGVDCYDGDNISTYAEDTMGLNRSFKYNFDYLEASAWDEYGGTFSIASEYPCENYVWLKEGDLVDISPELVNHPGFAKWNYEHKEIAGKKGLRIETIDYGDYKVYDDEQDFYEAIPAIYVKKHIPEIKKCMCDEECGCWEAMNISEDYSTFKYCPLCGKELK